MPPTIHLSPVPAALARAPLRVSLFGCLFTLAASPAADAQARLAEHVDLEHERSVKLGERLAGAGRAIALIGDIDGDDVIDLAVSATTLDPESTGEVWILSGRKGRVREHLEGFEAGSRFGSALAVGPDLDGDGLGELYIAAPHTNGEGERRGAVHVYSPGRGALLGKRSGKTDGGEFGASLGWLGDLSSGRSPTLGVGAPGQENNRGAVFLWNVEWIAARNELRWNPSSEIKGVNSGGRFGSSLSKLGDLNSDGWPEFLVGAPYHDGKRHPNAGMVTVVDGLSGRALRRLVGQEPGGLFGEQVCGLGDVEGDGEPDFLISAPSATVGEQGDAGRVWLYSGFDYTALREWSGNRSGDFFGRFLGGGQDLNGDGRAEFWVGAPYADEEVSDPDAERRGELTLYDGNRFSELARIRGPEPGGLFGIAAVVHGAAGQGSDGVTLVCGAPGRRGELIDREREARRKGLVHFYTLQWDPPAPGASK